MSSPQLDISGWPNKDKVCAQLGISDATLEREVKAGRWQTRLMPIKGRRPERRFDPEQLAERMPAPPSRVVKSKVVASMPAEIPAVASPMTELRESQGEGIPLEVVAQVVTAVMERFMGPMQAPQPQAQTLFVDILEASAVTGLSVSCLRGLVAEGRLSCIKDWSKSRHRIEKIRRADLETFEL